MTCSRPRNQGCLRPIIADLYERGGFISTGCQQGRVGLLRARRRGAALIACRRAGRAEIVVVADEPGKLDIRGIRGADVRRDELLPRRVVRVFGLVVEDAVEIDLEVEGRV